jgi:hypothetical protein
LVINRTSCFQFLLTTVVSHNSIPLISSVEQNSDIEGEGDEDSFCTLKRKQWDWSPISVTLSFLLKINWHDNVRILQHAVWND